MKSFLTLTKTFINFVLSFYETIMLIQQLIFLVGGVKENHFKFFKIISYPYPSNVYYKITPFFY
jgi:hypothetical protein